jgi:hypothetical protein
MIDFSEIKTGEEWELFGRDFLMELGLYIESQPDRGADGGKDILASEQLGGKLGQYKHAWLVSCKNNATSGKSVNETDEPNLLERIESFGADGFIGFYSTLASSGLNERLRNLRSNGKIKDYRIFDHKLIENHLISAGYSELLMRYFPENYKTVKPLSMVVREYMPIACKACGKDILKELFTNEASGNIIYAEKSSPSDLDFETKTEVVSVFGICKGSCDKQIGNQLYEKHRLMTKWIDLSELVIPLNFLRYVLSLLNRFRVQEKTFSDDAFEELKDIIIAISQKTLRETSAKDIEKVNELIEIKTQMPWA